jgi:hypothetical protein
MQPLNSALMAPLRASLDEQEMRAALQQYRLQEEEVGRGGYKGMQWHSNILVKAKGDDDEDGHGMPSSQDAFHADQWQQQAPHSPGSDALSDPHADPHYYIGRSRAARSLAPQQDGRGVQLYNSLYVIEDRQ